MKSRRLSKRKARARTRVRKSRHQRGGFEAPLASIVVSKQDPYSGGVLMTLEEALETKSNDPIRF